MSEQKSSKPEYLTAKKPEYLTAKEAAEFTGVCVKTFNQFCVRKGIEPIACQSGKFHLFLKSDIDPFPKFHGNYVTASGAADFLGVTVSTINRWVRAKKLSVHHHPVSLNFFYKMEELIVIKNLMLDESHPDVISREEAIALFGVSKYVLMGLERSGKLESCTSFYNAYKFYKRKDLQVLLDSRKSTRVTKGQD